MKKIEYLFDKYKILYFLFLTIVMIGFMDSYWLFLVISIFTLTLCVIYAKLDFCHPYCNILPIFVLYQVAFPILFHNGVKVFNPVPINELYYVYSWIASVLFIIFLGNMKNTINYEFKKMEKNNNRKFLIIIYIALVIFSIGASIVALSKGYASKHELAVDGNFFVKVGMMAYVALIPVTMLLFFDNNSTKKEKYIFFGNTLLIMFIGMMTLGERNYVFNFIIFAFLIIMSFKKISVKNKIILITAMVAFVSISPNLKMFFSKENIYTDTKREENIILRFLNSDFASAGYNFNYLLTQKENYEFKYGSTYVYDFLSPIDDIVSSVKKLNCTSWYQKEFWSTRKTGLGFTMIGEGFLNFGVIGIIISMFILAKIVRYLYLNSNKNLYYYLTYIAVINYSMYACRGSLANIISPVFKYYILLYIFIYYSLNFSYSNGAIFYKSKKILKIKE